MNSLKLIHTADWHFDSKFSGIKRSEVRKKRMQEIKETFKHVVDLAIDENVDLFLISGDLFEQNSFKVETINFIINILSRLKCPVLITPGNHDPYIDDSPYRVFDWGSNVHIFTENNFSCFKTDKAIVYGIADTLINDNKYCLREIKKNQNETALPEIVMFHGTYADLVPYFSEKDLCYPFIKEDLAGLDAQYVALGHFHQFKNLSFSHMQAVYPGTPEGLGFTDAGPRYAVIAEIEDKNVKTENIRINQRDFIKHKINVTGVTNNDALFESISDEIKKQEYQDSLIDLKLTGYASFPITNLNDIEDQLSSSNYYVGLKNNTIPYFNIEELKMNQNIVGEFTRKFEKKIAEADKPEEKVFLEKAMYYGVNALIGKEEIEID